MKPHTLHKPQLDEDNRMVVEGPTVQPLPTEMPPNSCRNPGVCCPTWDAMVRTPIRRALTGGRWHHHASSPQFSSVAQSCLTLCNPMDCGTPGFPVSNTISWSLLKLMSIELVMPSNHLIPPSSSSPAFNPSQHQGFFQWVSSSHQVAKVLEFQLQHQSFWWIFRTDFL